MLRLNSYSVKSLLLVGFSTCLVASMANAGAYDEAAQAVIDDKIKAWLNSDVVIDAVKAQNEAHKDLSQVDIDDLDKKWRAGDGALVDGVLGNALSEYLQGIKLEGEGLYTEIFVMDNKGLNVGQSDKTSDYWQGDEAKWQETYSVGVDAVHLSDVEEDESSQTFQMQISLTVVDGGEAIGAVTVGVNAELLE